MAETRRKIIKNLLVWFAVIYIFLALSEFSLRIFKYFIYDDVKKFLDIKNRKSLFRYDKQLGYTLNPGFRDGTGISINSLGLKGKEVDKVKSESVYRIIVLGDSIAFSYSESNADSWPQKLESLLNQSARFQKFEVVNAGIIGYTSLQIKRLLQTRLIELSPDMIIISIGWNDIVLSTFPKWYPEVSVRHIYKTKLILRLNNFMFIKLIKVASQKLMKFIKINQSASKSINSAALVHFEQNLQDIIELAKTKKIKVVLLSLPTILHTDMNTEEKQKASSAKFHSLDRQIEAHIMFNNIIEKVAKKNKIGLITSDLSRIDFKDKNKYFIDNCHFNKEGADKFTKDIYLELSKFL